MPKLWEQTGATLLARVAAAGEAALVFWTWAWVVYVAPRGGWDTFTTIAGPLFTDPGATTLLALAAAVSIVVVVSSALVTRCTTPVLRVLEGYWPPMLASAATRGIDRWATNSQELEAALFRESERLRQSKDVGALTTAQARQYRLRISALQVKLRDLPIQDELMPTQIGNIIRAGERRPAHWYGLDAVVVWPLLWLVLPDQARADISHARTALDHSVITFIWAVLSVGLGILWWPATIVGLVVAVLIWATWIPATARSYATLLSATFDTHRFALYAALHLPLPPTPDQERRIGEALTSYLWSGHDMGQNYAHPHQDPTTGTPPSGPPCLTPG